MTRDELQALVAQKCLELSEHCSTVQIFITKDPVEYDRSDVEVNAGDTVSLRYGTGNFFARYGQVIDFIKDIDAQRSRE